MIHTATATNVEHNFKKIIKEVHDRHDTVVITDQGEAVAALVDVEIFQKIHTLRQKFTELSSELSRSHEKLDSKIVEKEINEAVQAIRGKFKEE